MLNHLEFNFACFFLYWIEELDLFISQLSFLLIFFFSSFHGLSNLIFFRFLFRSPGALFFFSLKVMVVICSSLNFVFQVILYNATTSVWASKKWPIQYPALTLHLVACTPLSVISALSRPDLTLPWTSAYWEFFLLLDRLLWNFSCLLLSFFYLCHQTSM